MRITQRVIHMLLLACLGLACTSALAGAGVPQWKDTGPVTKKKQQEVNSGSWKPQAQPAPKEDQENPTTRARTVKPMTTAKPDAWRKPGIGTSVKAGGDKRLSRGIYLLTGRNQP